MPGSYNTLPPVPPGRNSAACEMLQDVNALLQGVFCVKLPATLQGSLTSVDLNELLSAT